MTVVYIFVFVFFFSISSFVNASTSVINLSKNNPQFLLQDGKTKLTFKKVHTNAADDWRSVQRRGDLYDLVATDDGLPYVSIDGQHLEIVHATKIYQSDYSFEIKNLGCTNVLKSGGDYSYLNLDSCKIQVETKKEKAPQLSPGISKSFSFQVRKRWQSLITFSEESFFLALRISSYLPGPRDESVFPPVVQSMAASFEIVTPFGVSNIEYDLFKDKPIVDIERVVRSGALNLTFIMKDVGNTNTHCWNKMCQNVFDAVVSVEQDPAEYAVVIGYYY